jgi:hypothetical protein
MRPVVYPADWLFRTELPPLGEYGRRLLAEGDSWFTIGTLNLPEASNILFKLECTQSTAIVNCAYPGDTLRHIVDYVDDPYFDRLLRHRPFASFWEAILISGGGNDLIDAINAPAQNDEGQPNPRDRRLLLTRDEVAENPSATGPERYISEGGWDRFATYLTLNFAELVRRRDEGPSRGRPMFAHTYAVPTIRPAGTIGKPQGWLYPAFVAFEIPQDDRQAVVELLFSRMRQLLLDLDQGSGQPSALAHLHVFDSAGLSEIEPALPGTTGKSMDWINEIHLTPDGYRKLGGALGARIDAVLATYP